MAKEVRTSNPLERNFEGVTRFPGHMPYEPEFKKDNSITQQTGNSDVPISEPLMDIMSAHPKALQKGYKTVATPKELSWSPDSRDTSRKGPWRPKGADASYRKNSMNRLLGSDRGPGGTNGY